MAWWRKQRCVGGFMILAAIQSGAVNNPIEWAHATLASSNKTLLAVDTVGVEDTSFHLFQDPAGALWSTETKRDAKSMGEIWMKCHTPPRAAGGHLKRVLTGRRGLWDAVDDFHLGSPNLFQYRNRYYMLYAANHPGPRTGLREIGVAVNQDPLHFTNRDKRENPVMVRNTERLARSYKTLLPSGEHSEWRARYVLKQPAANWMMPRFKTVGWRSGKGGFGDPLEERGVQIKALRTRWTSPKIWIRRLFDLPEGMPQTPVLRIRHEGAVQVFLNGKIIFTSNGSSPAYRHIELTELTRGAFFSEDNVLAVLAVAHRTEKFRALDMGLFDAAEAPVEPAIYGLDSPRVRMGPNGFERWITYQAYWNGVLKTGMDRVFFYGDEMVVAGPTTSDTLGYHPPPARPTFRDSFADGLAAWTVNGGDWQATNGMMQQGDPSGLAKVYLREKEAFHYLFEATLRFPVGERGEVGVVAYSDGARDLMVSINPADRTWSWRVEPSALSPQRFKWPEGLASSSAMAGTDGSSHRLRVIKNDEHFKVMLDDFLLTSRSLGTEFSGAGVPGLYSRNAKVQFENALYTVGWDEFGDEIVGWGAAADGTEASGQWRQQEGFGLEQRKRAGIGRAFKGERLDHYEFTVNARTRRLEEDEGQQFGVFPVFSDPDNYLKAMINTHRRELRVSGRRNGKPVGPFVRSLARRIPRKPLYDPETAYKDVAAWIYPLHSESVVTAFEVRWMEEKNDFLGQEFQVPMDSIETRYAQRWDAPEVMLWSDGHLRIADEPKPRAQKPQQLNTLTFRPFKATHVGVGVFTESSDDSNLEVPSTESRPQEMWVHVAVESSYFFRCVKLADRVIIELNGQPMLTLEGAWPPSQVGLLTEDQPCFFDGITRTHLPSAE